MKRLTLTIAQLLTAAAFVAVAFALSTGPASADIIKFTASLDGAQAVLDCPQGSPGTGTAQVTLDDVTNELTWSVSWQDLSGAAIDAHFHGPSAGPATTAPIEIAKTADLTSPSEGMATIDNAQETDLLAGLWYINIHTAKCPSGEIRGQVLQAPAPVGGVSIDATPAAGSGDHSLAWLIAGGSAAALASAALLAWRRVRA